MNPEDYRQLVGAFMSETQDFLQSLERDLLNLEKASTLATRSKTIENLFRAAHSIKGSALMFEFDDLSHCAHSLEDCFAVLRDWSDLSQPVSASVINLLLSGLDQLQMAVEVARRGNTHDPANVQAMAKVFTALEAEFKQRSPAGNGLPPSILNKEATSQTTIQTIFASEVGAVLQQLGTQIQTGLKTGSYEGLSQETRKLTGLAGMLQLPGFGRIAERLETLGSLGAAGVERKPLVAVFRQALLELQVACTAILEGQTDSAGPSAELQAAITQLQNQVGVAPRANFAEPSQAVGVVITTPVASSDKFAALFETVEEPEAPQPTQPVVANDSEVEELPIHLIFPDLIAPPETVTDSEPQRLSDFQSPAEEASADPLVGSFIRVEASRLNELVNLVGELVINRTNLETQVAQLRTTVKQLRTSTTHLQNSGAELREDYDRLTVLPQNRSGSPNTNRPIHIIEFNAEFDPLELDQYGEFHIRAQDIIETTQDIDFASDRTDKLVFDVERGLDQLRRVTNRLRSRVLQLRVLPFSHIVDPLPRAIRNLCRSYSKEVNLVLLGRELELDESILEELRDPLVHLVRNAFDHGIEPPVLRRQLGKSMSGEIEIRARRQGSQTLISIRDDGRGIDLEQVRAKAIERGLVSVGQAMELSPADLYSLLFTPEFSTADQITDLSGRGMGLDIVRAAVRRMRGSIAIDSTPGQGTTFTLKLPLVLSILQVLLVQVGQQTLAVPMDVIEEMLHIQPDRIQTAGQREMFRWRGEFLRLIRLSEALPCAAQGWEMADIQQTPTDDLSVLIVNVSNGYLAIQVDRLLNQKEIVVKALPAPLSKPKGIAGSTIIGDGSVVMIVDVGDLGAAELSPPALGHATLPQSSQPRSLQPALLNAAPKSLASTRAQTLTVMVVDDAYAVRRLVATCLARRQYQVLQAKDGQDALEQLQAGAQCHFILADLEMPRMNGFQLLQALKADARLYSIPVAVLTSRTGQKHRQIALELGANAHFIKPYKESELLNTIARLTQHHSTRSSPAAISAEETIRPSERI